LVDLMASRRRARAACEISDSIKQKPVVSLQEGKHRWKPL